MAPTQMRYCLFGWLSKEALVRVSNVTMRCGASVAPFGLAYVQARLCSTGMALGRGEALSGRSAELAGKQKDP